MCFVPALEAKLDTDIRFGIHFESVWCLKEDPMVRRSTFLPIVPIFGYIYLVMWRLFAMQLIIDCS